MLKTINRICSLYVILWVFIPNFQVGSIYRVLGVACAGIWLLTAINENASFFVKNQLFLLLSVLCILGMIISRAFTYSVADAAINTLQFIIMMIVAYIAVFLNYEDNEFLEKILTLFLVLLFIYCITTINGLFQDPYASRIANSEWLEGRYEQNKFVGLYGYIYMTVFIEPLLLFLVLKKIKVNRVFDIFAKLDLVIVAVMITFAGYTIAIVTTTIACLLICMICVKNKTLKYFVMPLIAIILLLSYKSIVDIITSYLIGITANSPVYRDKVIDIRSLLLTGDATGYTVEGRFKNYGHSFANIIDYPFIGSYFAGDRGGGGHSTILDTIGKFGWIISIMYWYLVFLMPHRIGLGKRSWMGLDYILLLQMLFIGFADPYAQEFCIPFYLFFPFVIKKQSNIPIVQRMPFCISSEYIKSEANPNNFGSVDYSDII